MPSSDETSTACEGCGHDLITHQRTLLGEVWCMGVSEVCSCTGYLRPGGEMWSLDHAAGESLGQQQNGPSVLTNVHPATLCAGRPCCLHNPSEHSMRDFPLNWRGDRGIMERLCAHGVGHPDPDDAAYRATVGDGDTTHGCDGCCVTPVTQ